MSEYIRLKQSNCKSCYKCIRSCPVKSIRFIDNQAHIVSKECILCGRCFTACPQNAKAIRNDIPAAKSLLQGSAPVYASIAPSFIANYDNSTILSIEKALKNLGFAGVEETAIGATLVKNCYDSNIANQDITISSCCHTVNLLIQMYYPEVLPYLSHVVSPMQAHCMDIKKRIPGAKTVFIGPCISKKAEAESYPGTVDCALTFEELSAWLDEEQIILEFIEDNNTQSRARLFPIRGGILKTMAANHPDYIYIALDGIKNCMYTIQEIIENKIQKCFIEMSACLNSCVGGPLLNKGLRSGIQHHLTVTRYAGEENFSVKGYPPESLNKKMPPLIQRRTQFGEDAINGVLAKIGKTKSEHELNCDGCGYNTCRRKARAVLDGKAELTMCLPYLLEKANSFSDQVIENSPNAILVLSEALDLQQINPAACALMNINNPKDVLGAPLVILLDPQPFLEAQSNNKKVRDRCVYLPEYEKYVDQTVVYDKNYLIFFCIMRDITDEITQRKNKEILGRATIEITDKVIEKQMRSVQEIASLLGETTAETKAALTKLKESLQND